MPRWVLAGEGLPGEPGTPAVPAEGGGLPAALPLSNHTVQYSWLAWLSCAVLLPSSPPASVLLLLVPWPASSPLSAACWMSSSSRVWGSASALTTASPSRSGKLGSGLTTGVAEPEGSLTRLLQSWEGRREAGRVVR